MTFVKTQYARGKNRARRATKVSESRKWKKTCDLAGGSDEYRGTWRIISLELDFAFGDDVEMFDRIARAAINLAGAIGDLVHVLCEPVEVVVREITEHGDFAEISDEARR